MHAHNTPFKRLHRMLIDDSLHTRFGPDWCFGLTKLKYKRSYVSSVSQLGDVVLHSTTKNINVPQHISDRNSGETLVPVCDWKMYLDKRFKKIPNITKYQHFRFSFHHPGCVFVRELPSSPEKMINLLLRPVQEVHFLPLPVVNHIRSDHFFPNISLYSGHLGFGGDEWKNRYSIADEYSLNSEPHPSDLSNRNISRSFNSPQ